AALDHACRAVCREPAPGKTLKQVHTGFGSATSMELAGKRRDEELTSSNRRLDPIRQQWLWQAAPSRRGKPSGHGRKYSRIRSVGNTAPLQLRCHSPAP